MIESSTPNTIFTALNKNATPYFGAAFMYSLRLRYLNCAAACSRDRQHSQLISRTYRNYQRKS